MGRESVIILGGFVTTMTGKMLGSIKKKYNETSGIASKAKCFR